MMVEIAIDPRLAIDCDELVSHWAADSNTRAVGKMRVADATQRTLTEPATITAVLIELGAALAGGAIIEAVKATYSSLCTSKNERPREIEFQRISKPDGTEITFMRLKE